MWIFSGLFQAAVVTALNLRTLRGRLASSGVAVVGMAGVVAVLVSVLSIAEGIRATMANTGSPDTAIVMRTGSDSEMTSILLQRGHRRRQGRAGDRPRARRRPARVGRAVRRRRSREGEHGHDGERLAARRRAGRLPGPQRQDGRGPAVRDRPQRDHRRQRRRRRVPRAGRRLARSSSARTSGTIVGIFDAGGTVPDSEVWCDAGVLAPLYRRGNSRQTVLRAADLRRGVHGVQGPADRGPESEAEGDARTGVLRRAGRDALDGRSSSSAASSAC